MWKTFAMHGTKTFLKNALSFSKTSSLQTNVYEITVSDQVGGWRQRGKIFAPKSCAVLIFTKWPEISGI